MRHAVLALLLGLAFVSTLGAAPAIAAPDPGDCDRTGDDQVTTQDALSALHEAVDPCRRDYYCDSDGDYETTASDALALLRYAVGLPQDLECSCIYVDECFEDEDCSHYGEGWFCAAYLCAQCDFDEECAQGEFCDSCSLQCQPLP